MATKHKYMITQEDQTQQYSAKGYCKKIGEFPEYGQEEKAYLNTKFLPKIKELAFALSSKGKKLIGSSNWGDIARFLQNLFNWSYFNELEENSQHLDPETGAYGTAHFNGVAFYAKQIGLPKTTAYRWFKTLVEKGVIKVTKIHDKYKRLVLQWWKFDEILEQIGWNSQINAESLIPEMGMVNPKMESVNPKMEPHYRYIKKENNKNKTTIVVENQKSNLEESFGGKSKDKLDAQQPQDQNSFSPHEKLEKQESVGGLANSSTPSQQDSFEKVSWTEAAGEFVAFDARHSITCYKPARLEKFRKLKGGFTEEKGESIIHEESGCEVQKVKSPLGKTDLYLKGISVRYLAAFIKYENPFQTWPCFSNSNLKKEAKWQKLADMHYTWLFDYHRNVDSAKKLAKRVINTLTHWEQNNFEITEEVNTQSVAEAVQEIRDNHEQFMSELQKEKVYIEAFQDWVSDRRATLSVVKDNARGTYIILNSRSSGLELDTRNFPGSNDPMKEFPVDSPVYLSLIKERGYMDRFFNKLATK